MSKRVALLYGRDGLLVDKVEVRRALPVIEMFNPGSFDEAIQEMADESFLRSCGIRSSLMLSASVKIRRFHLTDRFREFHGGDTLVYREDQ